MRFAWRFLLAAGGSALLTASCAAPPPPREETPLEKLRAKSNAYASFHYKADLTYGQEVVPIELAFRAPDRALLRYGPNFMIVVAAGVAHTFERGSYASVNYAEILDALRGAYGDLLPAPPQVAFTLGSWEMPIYRRGLLAALGVRPLGSRLGWLDEVAGYLPEGRRYVKGAIEVELRDDGFLERVKIANSASFALRELAIDAPLDDALFDLPPREKAADISEGRRKQREQELEESFHRWVLEARPDDAALEALVRVDLARLAEPAKMIEFQRQNLEGALEAYRKQQPEAPPLALREKIEIARGKALGSVEVMEDDLQKEFKRRLDRYLGLRGASAIAGRWSDAVSRQVDLQIRRPLDRVFAEKLKE